MINVYLVETFSTYKYLYQPRQDQQLEIRKYIYNHLSQKQNMNVLSVILYGKCIHRYILLCLFECADGGYWHRN